MFSLTRLSLSMAGFPKTVLLTILIRDDSPYPRVHALRFRLFPFRSPLLRESHVVFSSSGYLDVSVPRVPSAWLCIYHTVTTCVAGLPHSEICGSQDICSLPQLIAAYHVFHRLPVPRHSPCALVRLTFQTFFQNIWYPLDSLFCQRRLLLPVLLKLQYFLKELTIIFVSQLLFSFQGTSW